MINIYVFNSEKQTFIYQHITVDIHVNRLKIPAIPVTCYHYVLLFYNILIVPEDDFEQNRTDLPLDLMYPPTLPLLGSLNYNVRYGYV